MFGENPIEPINNQTDGYFLRVVKPGPWATIQGEGPYAGHPATFIRLHGCNLRCTFCDTQFSNPDDPTIAADDLVHIAKVNGYKLVVITGGEPFRQNIFPLCLKLATAGHVVQIETAGTLWLEGIQSVAKIVVSPKTPSIHPKIKRNAMAFKYIISAEDQHDGFLPVTATQPNGITGVMAAPRNEAPVYLSPMDQYDPEKNARNHKLVAELALRYNLYAGIQLHKYLMVD